MTFRHNIAHMVNLFLILLEIPVMTKALQKIIKSRESVKSNIFVLIPERYIREK